MESLEGGELLFLGMTIELQKITSYCAEGFSGGNSKGNKAKPLWIEHP